MGPFGAPALELDALGGRPPVRQARQGVAPGLLLHPGVGDRQLGVRPLLQPVPGQEEGGHRAEEDEGHHDEGDPEALPFRLQGLDLLLLGQERDLLLLLLRRQLRLERGHLVHVLPGEELPVQRVRRPLEVERPPVVPLPLVQAGERPGGRHLVPLFLGLAGQHVGFRQALLGGPEPPHLRLELADGEVQPGQAGGRVHRLHDSHRLAVPLQRAVDVSRLPLDVAEVDQADRDRVLLPELTGEDEGTLVEGSGLPPLLFPGVRFPEVDQAAHLEPPVLRPLRDRQRLLEVLLGPLRIAEPAVHRPDRVHDDPLSLLVAERLVLRQGPGHPVEGQGVFPPVVVDHRDVVQDPGQPLAVPCLLELGRRPVEEPERLVGLPPFQVDDGDAVEAGPDHPGIRDRLARFQPRLVGLERPVEVAEVEVPLGLDRQRAVGEEREGEPGRGVVSLLRPGHRLVRRLKGARLGQLEEELDLLGPRRRGHPPLQVGRIVGRA